MEAKVQNILAVKAVHGGICFCKDKRFVGIAAGSQSTC